MARRTLVAVAVWASLGGAAALLLGVVREPAAPRAPAGSAGGAGGAGSAGSPPSRAPAPPPRAVSPARPGAIPPGRGRPPAAPPPPRAGSPARPAPRGPLGARVLRRTQLRARPGGRVLRSVGTSTGYGSQRVLAVVARRGDWLGVLTEHRQNSRAAWIPAASTELLREPYTLHADLSEHLLVVRRRGRTVRRVTITIGRPGTATPTGRFAVTDALLIDQRGGPYGCCALALTGRQTKLPQGWGGGDRLAIHGQPSDASVGTAGSTGCLRARERDMRWLLAHVPLGATLRIRA